MRYIILVILNTPIILLALFNILTQYKMNKVSKRRFQHQLILWLIILVVLVCSFPFYNYVSGKPLLSSTELSLFDIAEITVIITMIYVMNSQRQKIERTETILRDLHQELSIKLSKDTNGQSKN
jgi:hypothetical protein